MKFPENIKKIIAKKSAVILITLFLFTSCNAELPIENISPLVPSSNSNTLSANTKQNYDELTNKFLKDMANAWITSQTWNDASQIDPDFLISFFCARTGLGQLPLYGEPAVAPAELVESFVKLYFDVDESHLRKAVYYNEDTNTYKLPISMGGAASFKVVDAVVENYDLTLFYEYYSPADDTTVIRTGNLKIEPSNEYFTRYKYVSCETTEIGE